MPQVNNDAEIRHSREGSVIADYCGAILSRTYVRSRDLLTHHTRALPHDVLRSMWLLLNARNTRCRRFHCPVEFANLVSWVLSQPGLKVFRATIIMARGPYEHTPWSSDADFIVAPSIAGY